MAGRTIEVSGIPLIPDEQLLVDFLEEVLGNGSVRTCRLIPSRSEGNSSSNCCKTEGDRKVRAIVETESAESAKTLHNLAKARILVFWCAALAVKFVSCPVSLSSFPPDPNIHDVPSDTKICVSEEKSPVEDLPLEPDVEQKGSIEGLQLEPDVEHKCVTEDLPLEAEVEQNSSREGLLLDADVEQKSSIEDLPLKTEVMQKNPVEDVPLEADFEEKLSSIEGLPLEAAVEKNSTENLQEPDVVQKSAIEGLQSESDVQQKGDLPLEPEVEQKCSVKGIPLEADVEQKSSIENLSLEAHAIESKVAPKQLSEPEISVLEVVNEPKPGPGPKSYVPEMFKPPNVYWQKMRESKDMCEPEISTSLPKDMSDQKFENDENLGSR